LVNISEISKKDTKEQVAEIVANCGGKVFKTANQLASAKLAVTTGAAGKKAAAAAGGNKNTTTNNNSKLVTVTEKSIDEFYTNLLTNPV
jgi:hypothetical protein